MTKLQKWSQTNAGTTRWHCPYCRTTTTKPREDLSRAFVLERFVAWLLGGHTQDSAAASISARTWRRHTSWCWTVVPRPELTGEIHYALILDAVRVGTLVCLIIRTVDYVITWQWAGAETADSWACALTSIPAPRVAVCDGQKGILKAVRTAWPNTTVQRCLFHVWLNTKTNLTLRPKTEAGRDLLALVRALWRVRTRRQMRRWKRAFRRWQKRYADFANERTYHTDPSPGTRKWWYTHGRLRSVYRQLAHLTDTGQLFAYVRYAHVELPRTTNHIEGGINSQIRTLLKQHRGLTQSHQQRLVDWYLYSRTEHQKPTRNVL